MSVRFRVVGRPVLPLHIHSLNGPNQIQDWVALARHIPGYMCAKVKTLSCVDGPCHIMLLIRFDSAALLGWLDRQLGHLPPDDGRDSNDVRILHEHHRHRLMHSLNL